MQSYIVQVRILEQYAKHIESVSFQGYRKEAEVVLKAKVDQEKYDTDQRQSDKQRLLLEEKFNKVDERFRTLNDEIYTMHAEIGNIQSNNTGLLTPAKANFIGFDDSTSDATVEFDNLSYEQVDKGKIISLSVIFRHKSSIKSSFKSIN